METSPVSSIARGVGLWLICLSHTGTGVGDREGGAKDEERSAVLQVALPSESEKLFDSKPAFFLLLFFRLPITLLLLALK